MEIDKVFSPFFGRKNDPVDQPPQMLPGFAAPVLAVQRVPEILDFATVALRMAGCNEQQAPILKILCQYQRRTF